MRETLPVVAGTLVSQTLLNLLALFLLAVAGARLATTSCAATRARWSLVSMIPVGLAAAVLIVPSLMEAGSRFGSAAARARSRGWCARPPRRCCGCAGA